jgi:hypothetical protein
MNENEKKTFESFVQKTLNLDSEAMVSLYNAEGELSDITPLLEKDAERVAKQKKVLKDQTDKAFKDGATKIERELKEKFELDSDLTGIELVNHLLETKTEEATQKFEELKKSKLKDDDFEKHPKFAALKLEQEKQLKLKDKEWEDRIKKMEAEQTRKETFDKIRKMALLELDSEFVMPENAERSNAYREIVLEKLEAENYMFVEDTPVILEKDGKTREDAHGKTVNVKDFIQTIAGKYFDKKVANARGNAANQNKPKNVSTDGQLRFKNRDEQTKAFSELERSDLNDKDKRTQRIKIGDALLDTQ